MRRVEDNRLIRPGVAAKRLGVTTETIRRWMRSGALPYTEVGPYRRKRLREADVEEQVNAEQQQRSTRHDI